MFFFPIPLAGNYGMIILIETIVNFHLTSSLQTLDILNGLVAPICSNEPLLPLCSSICLPPRLLWYLEPPELVFAPLGSSSKPWRSRIFSSVHRSLFWSLLSFILWPLFVVGSVLIWGKDAKDYDDYPTPEYMSAVIGASSAAIFVPVWATINLRAVGMRIERTEQIMELEQSEREGGRIGGKL